MIQAVFSTKTNVREAVADIKEQIKDSQPKAVIYFGSSDYDQPELVEAMSKCFPSAQLLGCSTAGELVSGHMLKNSLVAMALGDDVIDFAEIEVMPEIESKEAIDAAFGRLSARLECPIADLDVEKYVGLVLLDGLNRLEEVINERIGDLTNVLFIGGSAGDNLKFEQTWVHANGHAYSGAAVLALLKTKNGFDILKTQSFDTCEAQLIPTKVDEATRTVYKFNNQPAIEAYANAIGKNVDDAANSFMHNPLGLMVDSEPYVRSPQQIKGESMVFYCAVKEGMALRILESRDIVADTKRDLDAKLEQLGPVKGIINFHCILRTLELDQNGQTQAYGELFSDIPTIGFSTYGESYIGHINQTSTMLLFK